MRPLTAPKLPACLRRLAPLALPVLLGVACGPYQGDLEGTWDGAAFSPTLGYWGGPFIMFTEQDLDCTDLWWMSRNYLDDEAPWDQNVRLMQITFQEADVVEGGPYEVSGVSPVQATLLEINDGDLFEDEARNGTLTIEKIDNGERVHGELDMAFASGDLAGSFTVERCVNMDAAY